MTRQVAVLAALLLAMAPALARGRMTHDHESVALAADRQSATTMAAGPTISPAGGTYPAPLSVALATTTAGATIYYTSDGSTPSRRKSPTYTAPLQFSSPGTVVVQAFAYKKGLKASYTVKASFTVTPAPPPPETGGTLFLATLTPQGNASTAATGAGSLTLTQDQSAAYLRFSYQGLSGPITSEHIHGPDGTILFDIDTTPPRPDGSRLWRIVPAGTFSTAAILTALRNGQCYLNLHTALYPSGEIKGYFHQASGSQTFTPPPAPPPLPGGPPTANDAARFLLQSTFGPRAGDVEALQQKGFGRWLDEQMALPPTSHLAQFDALIAASGEDPSPTQVRETILQQAVQAPDQLRQRMVFALSQLFVISDNSAPVRNAPDGMAAYVDLLGANAFGNFRDLLEAVTLSPAMGVYLDMAGSSKTIPTLGVNPNENYAREIMQLFSIGLYELFPDGSLHLDGSNQPVATYDQNVVMANARALTGWTLGGQNKSQPLRFFHPARNFRIAMDSWPAYHDTDPKSLLGGVPLLPGQSAQQDLEDALDVIFQHPNVGPFFCRFLIQRMVTSNPSPAYVYRCGQAFDNNGAGVRGDLSAVLRTVLLDYEARSPDLVSRSDDGHLAEPYVRTVALLRAVNAIPNDGRWRLSLESPGRDSGQTPLHAPTVFNFFEPSYALPGEIASAGLVSPEFQITTDTTLVGVANLELGLLRATSATGTWSADLSPFLAPQVANDGALLDRINQLFYAGSMSDTTRGLLAAALADPKFPRQPDLRVKQILWLAAIAPESVVQR